MSEPERDSKRDRELGMDRPISRRDFMNGAAMAIGASLVPGSAHAAFADSSSGQASEPQNRANYDPPILHGLRGSHPGSFEIAHSLRDGTFWKSAGKPTALDELYDLIVVGGGISGLSAAYFYRERAGKSARILILENHDDFGGHAKRNEFHLGGKLQLLNGGTMLIDSPTPYSAVADGLLKKLGIDPVGFEEKYTDGSLYRGLGPAIFFDKETFGEDRLVTGDPGAQEPGKNTAGLEEDWRQFLKRTPLTGSVQQDILRIEAGTQDYLPGLSSAEKKDRLSRISYKDFLLKVAKVDAGVIPFYQTRTNGEWGVGIDAEPALDCWALGLPGFQGMHLEPGAAPRMSFTAAGYANGGSYRFHFPDGNASITRLLVRDLISGSIPGHTAEDVVTANVDYAKLDEAGAPLRLRLNSTVVGVRNIDAASNSKEVEVSYASGKELYKVRAKGCVLACWNMMVPFLCPELPKAQKEALHYLVKVPLVYTGVGIRNSLAFHKLGISGFSAPGGYWSSARLNWPMKMGVYETPRSPEEPTLLFLNREPCQPGLTAREQQIAGRMELYVTPFETFERKIRDQLARALPGGGFDPARDIEAITVNRWPHGYGYEYNPLFDPEWPEDERPNVIGRKPFGRITIANTDSAATAYTDAAINEAYRAVRELLPA